MHFFDVVGEYGTLTIFLLALSAFAAGFIDSVVGGGGLIQTPFLLITFPTMPLAVLFGTNKIAALAGTTFAAFKYAQKIRFDFSLLLVIGSCCFVSSFIGAQLVNAIDTRLLKPLVLLVLIVIALYTLLKKDLGSVQSKQIPLQKQMFYGAVIGTIVGFYDGFFGPGTGSFFVLGFVVVLGFEFVKASAYAKVVNCVTNISALIVFIRHGNFILPLAILLAVFNITGSVIGSSMALKKGNEFVRIVFLVIVSMMIVKYGYDVLTAN
jgi:uncharacterized membrane protein YfcA